MYMHLYTIYIYIYNIYMRIYIYMYISIYICIYVYIMCTVCLYVHVFFPPGSLLRYAAADASSIEFSAPPPAQPAKWLPGYRSLLRSMDLQRRISTSGGSGAKATGHPSMLLRKASASAPHMAGGYSFKCSIFQNSSSVRPIAALQGV